MKQIQPIQIWVNGQEQTGNYINCYISYDNLKDSSILENTPLLVARSKIALMISNACFSFICQNLNCYGIKVKLS